MERKKLGLQLSLRKGFFVRLEGREVSCMLRLHPLVRLRMDGDERVLGDHVDGDLTRSNALDPAHHPDTLIQLDDAYVVIAAPFGLSAHNCCGVDPSLAPRLHPRNRAAMTMGTQDSREKVIGPAVVALWQQDLSLCQRALEKLVWSFGVLHRRSPSSDPVFV